jgi:hypothetical protein
MARPIGCSGFPCPATGSRRRTAPGGVTSAERPPTLIAYTRSGRACPPAPLVAEVLLPAGWQSQARSGLGRSNGSGHRRPGPRPRDAGCSSSRRVWIRTGLVMRLRSGCSPGRRRWSRSCSTGTWSRRQPCISPPRGWPIWGWPPTGKPRWNVASVRGILRNPAYAGQAMTNRTRVAPAAAASPRFARPGRASAMPHGRNRTGSRCRSRRSSPRRPSPGCRPSSPQEAIG